MHLPTPPTPPDGASLPRKHPQQARSRITVDAILEATAQVLTSGGYAALTTVLVAERAGVSVGTLYQYYPDKAALVGAIIEEHLAREAEALAEAFEQSAALDLPSGIEALVRAYVDVNAANPQRSAAIMIAAPHVEWSGGIATLANQGVQAVRALLTARAAETRVADPEAAAYVMTTAIHGLVQFAVTERPEFVASGRLVAEACDLARRYLCDDAVAVPNRPSPPPTETRPERTA